jgi:hypothetical protein
VPETIKYVIPQTSSHATHNKSRTVSTNPEHMCNKYT